MRSLRTAVALTALVAMAAALPAVAAETVTVGQFIQRLAQVKQLDATEIGSAVKSLARVGVRIPAGTDYSKRLTEADVVRLSRLAGLNVTTTQPESEFDDNRLQSFFKVFGNELGIVAKDGDSRANTRTPDFDPYSKGNGGSKGKKKGHRSPSDPE